MSTLGSCVVLTPAINGLATRYSTSETQQQQEDKHHVACLVCGFSNVCVTEPLQGPLRSRERMKPGGTCKSDSRSGRQPSVCSWERSPVRDLQRHTDTLGDV